RYLLGQRGGVVAASGEAQWERCPHVATTACEWWDVACHKRAQSHAWTARPSSAPTSRSSPWQKVSFVSVRSYTPPFNTSVRWCCIDRLNAPDLPGTTDSKGCFPSIL